MADVREILARKGHAVYCTRPGTTVLHATQQMNQHKIGALAVVEDDRLVGMFTERDVLTRIVAVGRDPTRTHVEDVMSADLAVARLDMPLEEARGIMKQRRIRHLPVCNETGKLLGMISIGDLNAWDAQGAEITIHYLSEYIHGRT